MSLNKTALLAGTTIGKTGRVLKGPPAPPKEGQIDPRDYGLFEVGYSPQGLTDRFPIGLTKIYQLIDEGELCPLKLGKRTIILAVDFAAFLERLKAQGGTLGQSPNPKARAKPRQEPTLTPPVLFDLDLEMESEA
jgi:hypothetical protein